MEYNQPPIKQNNNGNIIGGLILICVGVALTLRQMDFPFPRWLFSWPMILILIGTYIGFKSNFRNNAWIIMIVIGGFFLIDRFMPDMPLSNYFWPLAIIVVGVIFILRPSKKNKTYPSYKTDESTGSWQAFGSSTGADSNNYLIVESVFSGVQRAVLSKNFQGGNISCVFGGAEIDLTQADINGTVVLKMDAVFGGIKLIVPPHWQVINEIEGVFHGVDDKRKSPAGAYNDINKTLVIRGSAVFGGIEIRSY
jgi:predicted membrane protein